MIPIICSLQSFGENRFFSRHTTTYVSVILPSGIPNTTNSLLYYIFFSYRIPYCPAKLSQCNESQLSAFTLYALAEDRSTVIFKNLWTKVRRFLTSCLHNSPKSWGISSRQNKSWKEFFTFFTIREHLLSIFDRHLLLHIFLFFLHHTLPVGKASYLLTAKNCTAYVALWFPTFTPASAVFLVSK